MQRVTKYFSILSCSRASRYFPGTTLTIVGTKHFVWKSCFSHPERFILRWPFFLHVFFASDRLHFFFNLGTNWLQKNAQVTPELFFTASLKLVLVTTRELGKVTKSGESRTKKMRGHPGNKIAQKSRNSCPVNGRSCGCTRTADTEKIFAHS